MNGLVAAVGAHYVALVWTTQKTPLPTFPPLLHIDLLL
jgi:hypothetical protein